MQFFKRVTTLQRINDQIYGAEKSLLEHQGTADHYLALADGNRKTLSRLRAMRSEEVKPVPVQPHIDVDAGAGSGGRTPHTPKPRLRSAS